MKVFRDYLHRARHPLCLSFPILIFHHPSPLLSRLRATPWRRPLPGGEPLPSDRDSDHRPGCQTADQTFTTDKRGDDLPSYSRSYLGISAPRASPNAFQPSPSFFLRLC